MNTSRLLRTITALAALVGGISVAPSEALALTPSTSVVIPLSMGQCVRSGDITFDGESYVLAWEQGACLSPSTHQVWVIRINATTLERGSAVQVVTSEVVPPSLHPLVSVSAIVPQTVVVAAAIRTEASTHRLVAQSFNARTLAPLPSSATMLSVGQVRAISLDCDASEDRAPCTVATIENTSGAWRAVTRLAIAPDSNVTPMTTVPNPEVVRAIAAVGGGMAFRGSVAVTSVLDDTPAVIFSPTDARNMFSWLDARRTAPWPGVAALRLRSGGVAAAWGINDELCVVSGSNWSTVPPVGAMSACRMPRLSPMHRFVPTDAAQVGGKLLIVGYQRALFGELASGRLAVVEHDLAAPSGPLDVRDLNRTELRFEPKVAAATSCPLLGQAVSIVGAEVSSGVIQITGVRYTCSNHSECVDPNGVSGVCENSGPSGSRCVFTSGVCGPIERDSGVPLGDAAADAGQDSSASDAAPSSDVALDDGGDPTDASSIADGAQPPIFHGGACACRAPARGLDSAHMKSLSLLALSLATLTQLTRRRAR